MLDAERRKRGGRYSWRKIGSRHIMYAERKKIAIARIVASLSGTEEMTVKEITAKLHISRQRVYKMLQWLKANATNTIALPSLRRYKGHRT